MMKTQPQKITKEKALIWKSELIAVCKKYGIWFDVVEKNTPDLKNIIVSASVRVTE